jgi:hypothetical protein
MHLTSLPHCLYEKGDQEPFQSIFVFLVTSTLLDRGWSMKLSFNCVFLAVCNRTNASRQSTNPTILCKRGDVFACCSVRLSPGRKSDLQMHRTPSAFGDYRVLSDTGRMDS